MVEKALKMFIFFLTTLRLGFLIDFLSHAAVVGFMGGAAITIALQQLKGFLGIKKFTKKTDIISVLESVFKAVHHGWNWQTILIGASFLTFLLTSKIIGKKSKKLFWVPAIAPLISVIVSTFFVYITRADKQGVQIVRSQLPLTSFLRFKQFVVVVIPNMILFSFLFYE